MDDESKPAEPVEKAGEVAARRAERADELARLSRIEAKLGVPAGFYQGLRDQGSDWEFAIKLVVLLEAALGNVVASTLQNDAMRDHCDRLNLVGRTGKLDLAQALQTFRLTRPSLQWAYATAFASGCSLSRQASRTT